jgi:cytohesin
VQVPETLHHFAGQGNVQRVHALLESGADLNGRDADGATPLHWAADRGQQDMVSLLLNQGADISVQDHEGMTALHYAGCNHQQEVCFLCILHTCGSAKETEGAKGTAGNRTRGN